MPDLNVIARKAVLRAVDDLIHDRMGLGEILEGYDLDDALSERLAAEIGVIRAEVSGELVDSGEVGMVCGPPGVGRQPKPETGGAR